MTHCEPVEPGHVPSHVRDAFAEGLPSYVHPTTVSFQPGWYYPDQMPGAYWLRSQYGAWFFLMGPP